MKKREPHPINNKKIYLVVAYTVMVLAIIAAVTIATFFMLGYRLNFKGGGIEQYALLQFDSSPTGASVWVDSTSVLMNTPNKATVAPGIHEISIWKSGYETWRRTTKVTAGSLSWPNYALLIPQKITTKSIYSYDEFYAASVSPIRKTILTQSKSDTPTFNLVDISNNDAKSTELTIPAASYTAANDNTYQIVKWDESGRYVLIKHSYGATSEWLVLDTHDVSATKNLTTMFGVNIDDATFASTDGSKFYVLTSETLRLANSGDGTLSKVLVSNVKSFDFNTDTNVVTYSGLSEDRQQQVAGIYQGGDSSSVIIQKFSNLSTKVRILSDSYNSVKYLIIAEGQKVTVWSGDYPTATKGAINTLDKVKTFNATKDIDQMSFGSASPEYLLVRFGTSFVTYDLEYDTLSRAAVDGSDTNVSMDWLVKNYLWSIRDNKLSIRYFDGTNAHVMASSVANQSPVLTQDGKYLYYFKSVDGKVQLQRIQMIIN